MYSIRPENVFLSGTANTIVFHFPNILLYYYSQDLFRKRSAHYSASAQALWVQSDFTVGYLFILGTPPFQPAATLLTPPVLAREPTPWSAIVPDVSSLVSVQKLKAWPALGIVPSPPAYRAMSSVREVSHSQGHQQKVPEPDSNTSEEKPKTS